MEIRFLCFRCGRKLKADEEASGQRSNCPDCGTELIIPMASGASSIPEQQPDGTRGKYTCPTCWLKFNTGDIMHISVHESLKGDPVLGEDAQQRFHAMRFNDQGQALDAMGMVCTEIACPYCRRRLPLGFIDEPHHIISLVGDQSSGKSYFLTVLSKVMPTVLFQHFGITMQDADPTGNGKLNELRKTLFAASTPDQVQVIKTVMEGDMYERLPRQGRKVALPRPFIYTMGASDLSKQRCSVIFYDNAGEHFQPGIRLTDQPGALHVASASGLLFLFDPFNSPDFRHAMQGITDPQMENQIIDQQDIILAELRSRILTVRSLPSNSRLSAPLAVMVGKYDAWRPLLPETLIENPVRNGSLNLDTVHQNSSRIRQLLLGICPRIVANAETLSSDVSYFTVSAFGHPPIKIGPGPYPPDPAKLKPFQVEVPVLWLLAKLCPELIPVSATGMAAHV